MYQMEWINRAKGFGMICVVFGHAIIGSVRATSPILGAAYDYIYIFHMPLFFFLAGILFENNKKKYVNMGRGKFIRHKFRTLMIPYFTYSIFTYAVLGVAIKIPRIDQILIAGGYQLGSLKEILIQVLFWQNSLDQHLWFVYALFVVFVLNISAVKKINKKYDALFFCSVIIIHCLTLQSGYYIIQRICNYQVYFVLGRLCYKYKFLEKVEEKQKTWAIYVMAIFLSISKMQIIYLIFDSYILTVLKALYSICVSFSMVIAICFIFKSKRIKRINYIFDYIYKYNFEIYILHQPFIVSGSVILLLSTLKFNSLFVVFIATLFGIIVSVMCTRILNKFIVVRKLLFGKSN